MAGKILVTGPNGFVGRYVMSVFPDAVPAPGLRGDENEVAEKVRDADCIIHTAAISDMGSCEADPEASYRANVLLPLWIARAAKDAKLVFFSTDQVYNGCNEAGPYTEDMVCPANVYARHKLEMEQRVLDLRPDAVMLRATWMFDARRGYLANLLRSEGTVTSVDQLRAVTWVQEAAEQIRAAMNARGGAYNFGCENELPIPELTHRTLVWLGSDARVLTGEKRRDLRINTAKARAAGISFRSSEESLRACIDLMMGAQEDLTR